MLEAAGCVGEEHGEPGTRGHRLVGEASGGVVVEDRGLAEAAQLAGGAGGGSVVEEGVGVQHQGDPVHVATALAEVGQWLAVTHAAEQVGQRVGPALLDAEFLAVLVDAVLLFGEGGDHRVGHRDLLQ